MQKTCYFALNVWFSCFKFYLLETCIKTPKSNLVELQNNRVKNFPQKIGVIRFRVGIYWINLRVNRTLLRANDYEIETINLICLLNMKYRLLGERIIIFYI